MKKERTKKLSLPVLLLLLILIASLASSLYWGSRKEGYHVDEMYMYGTANSEYLPFMHLGEHDYTVRDWMYEYGAGGNIIDLAGNLAKDVGLLSDNGWKLKESEIYRRYQEARAASNDMYSTTWMSGQDYRDYLSAGPEGRFNYFSVLYNFRGDNHPPLYALLLHTVCSFFPGEFSKWFGICLNAVITILTLLLLHRLVREQLGGERVALLVTAAYALSVGAAMINTYIRMYVLVTLMTVGLAKIHLSIREADWEIDKKKRRRLVFYTVGGFLSQFYFVVYAFGIALAASVIQLKEKRYKQFFHYLRILIFSAVLGVVLWPFSIRAVFFGSRGEESIGGFLSLSDTPRRLWIMLQELAEYTLGLPALVYLGLLVVFFVLIAVRGFAKKESAALQKAALLITPFVLYFVTISKMIPYLTDRYIMLLFPWSLVFVITAAAWLLKRLLPAKKPQLAVLLAFWALCLFFSDSLRVGNYYIYEGMQECDEIAGNTDCVYLEPAAWWNVSAEDTLLLSRCRNVAVVREDSLPELAGSYSAAAGDTLLLVVREGVDTEADAEWIQKELPAGGSLVESERKSVRGNLWILYRVED